MGCMGFSGGTKKGGSENIVSVADCPLELFEMRFTSCSRIFGDKVCSWFFSDKVGENLLAVVVGESRCCD